VLLSIVVSRAISLRVCLSWDPWIAFKVKSNG